MRQLLSWLQKLMKSDISDRKEAVKIAMDGIKTWENGNPTKKGQELYDLLKHECQLIGFCPNASYTKVSGNKEELNCVWVHPFGQRTLLFKHKDYPLLLICNSSIELNDSALRKITGNESVKELLKILGITG